MKFITLITDCKDDNARARQKTRWAGLFPGVNIASVGTDSSLGINATIEASGNLVDILDASGSKKGIVMVNVAPRGQVKEDGDNGSAFCYFWFNKTLVVSTFKGYNLSLLKKLHLISHINLLDTKQVLEYASLQGIIPQNLASQIANSQFRSFDFVPRVAKWVIDGISVPSKKIYVDKIADAPSCVWYIDSFGNIKTTLIEDDLPCKEKPFKVKTNVGELKYYNRLKDIPDRKTAIYIGSSGIGEYRFLEIATQNTNGSAQKLLNLKIGDEIKIV